MKPVTADHVRRYGHLGLTPAWFYIVPLYSHTAPCAFYDEQHKLQFHAD